MRRNFLKNFIYGLFALVLLWAGWLIAHALTGNEWLIPSFSSSMREAGQLLVDKSFWTAFSHTLLRTVLAFVISFILAVIFAVVAYMVPPFRKIFSPIVSFLRILPTMAVLLIILVWTTPKTAPVVVAFLALFPMLYTGVLAALSTVDADLVEMSKVYRIPLKKQILQLYLPFAAPYVLKESAAALSFSLKLVVSAEVLANTYQSLGGMLQTAKIYVEMPQLFALTFLVILIGFLLEGAGQVFAYMAERRAK